MRMRYTMTDRGLVRDTEVDVPPDAPPELTDRLRPFEISYAGDAEPIPTNWVCGLR